MRGCCRWYDRCLWRSAGPGASVPESEVLASSGEQVEVLYIYVFPLTCTAMVVSLQLVLMRHSHQWLFGRCIRESRDNGYLLAWHCFGGHSSFAAVTDFPDSHTHRFFLVRWVYSCLLVWVSSFTASPAGDSWVRYGHFPHDACSHVVRPVLVHPSEVNA